MSVWFWVTLWIVLVLTTVIGAIVLGRWLLAELRALLTEMRHAEELAGPALTRLNTALDSTPETRAAEDDTDTRPSMFSDDLTTHYGRVAALREERRERRAARHERHQVTWQRWARFNDPAAHEHP